MTHEEKIMQAHKKGKTIQYRKNNFSEWTDMEKSWDFYFDRWEYRIKPKSRPSRNAEEVGEKLRCILDIIEKVVFIVSMVVITFAVYYAIFVAHLWITTL